jgi:hypothetical protein
MATAMQQPFGQQQGLLGRGSVRIALRLSGQQCSLRGVAPLQRSSGLTSPARRQLGRGSLQCVASAAAAAMPLPQDGSSSSAEQRGGQAELSWARRGCLHNQHAYITLRGGARYQDQSCQPAASGSLYATSHFMFQVSPSGWPRSGQLPST